MLDHIINIYSSELLSTKTKESRINEYKNIFKKWIIYIFLPNITFLQAFLKS